MLELARYFLYYFPAYVANAVPVLCRGRRAIDSVVGEGTFGKNKTWRGLFCGIGGGVVTAILLSPFTPLTWVDGLLQGLGAMAGDLLGSFIKRRLGIREGGPFITDASLFIMLAMAFDAPLWPYLDWWALAFVVATVFIHRLTNVAAFFLRLKGKPW